MAKHWIKLWVEMLDDPKMGRLTDHLYRRAVELFLLAGSVDDDGILPPIEDIAWRLRTTTDELMIDLMELGKVGIITLENDEPTVTNYAKRQASADPTAATRMQQWRDRNATNSDKPVTRNVTRNAITPVTKKLRVEEEEESESEQNRGEEESESEWVSEAQAAPALASDSDLLLHWTMVTGMMTFPAISYASDLNRLHAIYQSQRGAISEYLKPFWSEWVNRGYSRSNTAWLDWAVAGQIPERRTEPGRNGSKPAVNDTAARLQARKNGRPD